MFFIIEKQLDHHWISPKIKLNRQYYSRLNSVFPNYLLLIHPKLLALGAVPAPFLLLWPYWCKYLKL